MSSTTETRTLVDEIVDNADERELFIVGKLFEHPPYFHAGKGGDTRLARAIRVCLEDRITPNSDGSYLVEGSEHRTYRVDNTCSCPNSQKAKSKYCYHFVAVCLYIEWQRRLHPTAPVALGTLRPGTLPLPPTTADERLATSVPQTYGARLAERALGPVPLPPTTADERLAQAAPETFDPAPLTTAFLATLEPQEDRMPDEPQVRITVDGVDYPPHTPQEYRMPDDESIPEPESDEPSQAILDAPGRKEERKEGMPPTSVTRPLPGPGLLPALDARTLEESMQAWSEQRKVVRRFLQQELVEGTDYYTLVIKGKETKPALSKAGSEKFIALFQLHPTFAQDSATWTMLGQPEGTLCYVCTLHTRSGDIVGEGRGARRISQDGGDINKTVKMACKSSMVDAILRTGALSDVFTQDEESIPEAVKSPPAPTKPTGQEYRQRIWAMVKTHAPDVTTREQVETWIKAETGYTLHPDNYRDIIESLAVRA